MATREVQTQVTIEAPRLVVWRVLLDVARYSTWSPSFRFGGTLRAGSSVWLHLRLHQLPLALRVRVETLEPERELRWTGGPRSLLRGSHYMKLAPASDGRATALVHGEAFCGLATGLMWPLMESELLRLYRGINEGLAARAEALHARERVRESAAP